jgi:hypothetical protein
VAEVGIPLAAQYFGPFHEVAASGRSADVPVHRPAPKSWSAAAQIKFFGCVNRSDIASMKAVLGYLARDIGR